MVLDFHCYTIITSYNESFQTITYHSIIQWILPDYYTLITSYNRSFQTITQSLHHAMDPSRQLHNYYIIQWILPDYYRTGTVLYNLSKGLKIDHCPVQIKAMWLINHIVCELIRICQYPVHHLNHHHKST